MESQPDPHQIPLLWINLKRATKRRARMNWAIQQGGWAAHRFVAIDGRDENQQFLPIPNLLKVGSKYPGVYRMEEAEPKRRTNRAELACLASWKRLLMIAAETKSPSGWLLMMEDDLGASLAKPNTWAHSLLELINFCPTQTLAIQLAPINHILRKDLAERYLASKGRCLAVSKEEVRSHGNGAILINKRALPYLIDPLLRLSNFWKKSWHPLLHPWRIRPVADKWIYGALPQGCCQVATYPHFCLDAEDSTLHLQHVDSFHRPSRQITLKIWERDKRQELIEAQYRWDHINQTTESSVD